MPSTDEGGGVGVGTAVGVALADGVTVGVGVGVGDGVGRGDAVGVGDGLGGGLASTGAGAARDTSTKLRATRPARTRCIAKCLRLGRGASNARCSQARRVLAVAAPARA